jgi:hypothetical protein
MFAMMLVLRPARGRAGMKAGAPQLQAEPE